MGIPPIQLSNYDYPLSESNIAYTPTLERTKSKLLVYAKGKCIDSRFDKILEHIDSNSALYFNNTEVVHARLLFPLANHTIEIFCLEGPDGSSLESILPLKNQVQLGCFIGKARKWKGGFLEQTFHLQSEEKVVLKAEKISNNEGLFQVKLTWNGDLCLSEILEQTGHVPLPPYIRRGDESSDKNRYQTVYAEHKGSVAAPTAGLHFDSSILESFDRAGIERRKVTLHVGAGTFKPVEVETADLHPMHKEEIRISIDELRWLTTTAKKIGVVGTTSMRTLESLYWLGLRAILEPTQREETLPSDFPYRGLDLLDPKLCFAALISECEAKSWEEYRSFTQLFIVPGYRFQVVDYLITNFHQPKSTLLLLIAAFIGNDWRLVYNHALNQDYRFLSYGDAQLYFRQPL